MAKLLGYGDEKDYAGLRAQITALEGRIAGHPETSGTFARLRKSLDGIQSSLFE